MSYYREQLERWLGQIEVKADRVLDIGGGANPVKNRVKSWDVKEYKILDNQAEPTKQKIDHLKDLNKLIDLEEIFDIIFCLEVFEYIWNPAQAMENIASFLKEGGTTYISFPTIYPIHNPQEIDFLRYTKRGIKKLLEMVEFSRWDITPRVASEGRVLLAGFYAAEKMHPVKSDIVYDIGYLVKAIK